MTKIFADAEEKYVKNVILYGHTDNYLYTDAEHTQKVDKDTVMNLCKKGVLVDYQSAFYAPISFKENSGHLEVVIATGDTSLTGVILYSEEYAAG